MPKPTLTQIFGTGAVVVNGKLTIDFADFAAVGWNNAAGTTDAEKWFAAILKRAREFYSTNTDQVPACQVNAPFLGLANRNGVTKREYSYGVQVWETDSGASSPDPDNL